jgi:hypothetical protein
MTCLHVQGHCNEHSALRTHLYRRRDVAAVSAIANGSQLNTMSPISHRIARSESVSYPTISAT